jgi:hypothetical protein
MQANTSVQYWELESHQYSIQNSRFGFLIEKWLILLNKLPFYLHKSNKHGTSANWKIFEKATHRNLNHIKKTYIYFSTNFTSSQIFVTQTAFLKKNIDGPDADRIWETHSKPAQLPSCDHTRLKIICGSALKFVLQEPSYIRSMRWCLANRSERRRRREGKGLTEGR